MYKYAILDFDLTDSADQFAIVYNNFTNGAGDTFIEWFNTEEERARRVEKDIQDKVIFLSNWESRPCTA